MILKKRVPLFARIIGLLMTTLLAATALAQDKVDFAKDVKPIFEKYCLECHGPVPKEDEDNDFRIDEREDALDFTGTDGSEESDLFQLMISDDDEELMPPPEHSKLTPDQIAVVKTWIDQGADWPEGVALVAFSETEDDGTETPDQAAPDQAAPDQAAPDKAAPDKAAPNETGPANANPNADEDGAAKLLTTEEKTKQIFNAVGSLHTAAVHLPIGLLLASGLFALFSLRGNFVMSDCAYYCLWLGTLGAIVACLSGWWYSPMEHRGTVSEFGDLFDQTQDIFWHRTWSLGITAAALVLALFAAGARNKDPDDGMLWKLGLILLACGIGWVGHTGGELAYPNQYKDLNKIFERIVGGDDQVEPKAAEKKPEAAGENADVGKSSSESAAKPETD